MSTFVDAEEPVPPAVDLAGAGVTLYEWTVPD